jgi:dephospho-CoA kinase
VLLINGDEAGHEVLTQKTVQDAVRQRFGPSVFDAAGQIDRRALGKMVFGSGDEQQVARRDLERIVHPHIREIFEKRIAAASRKRVVLLDAAVLFEAGWNNLCHAVVFIDVPRLERLERLRVGRGWDEIEVGQREASQVSLETKRNRSQYVIDNAHSIDDAGRQLENLLSRINA